MYIIILIHLRLQDNLRESSTKADYRRRLSISILQIYLWVSLSSDQLTKCPSEHCHQYSPFIKEKSCPEIVSRDSWFARPPKAPLDRFTATPTVVSLSNSVCPRRGCYSNFACGNYLRTMQTYPTLPHTSFDIPYNFLVGEDGRVYEGRGADFVGAHTAGYNPISLGIAFIGWYEKRKPTVSSLVAVRRLLRCLVSRGNLTPTYELFGFRDLRPGAAPGFFLYEVMPNWGHYTEQRLPAGLHCAALRARDALVRYSLISGCVLICLLLIVCSVLYAKIFSHARWCPARHRSLARTRLLSSLGREDALEHNLNAIPARCTVRAAARLHIPPRRRALVLLSPRAEPCDCVRFFLLLWARCEAAGACDFAARAQRSALSRACRRHTVLLASDRVFLLHADSANALCAAVGRAASNRCVCALAGFTTEVADAPRLERLPLFDAGNVLSRLRQRDELGWRPPVAMTELCKLVDDEDVKYEDFEKEAPADEGEVVALDLSQQSGLNVTSLLL